MFAVQKISFVKLEAFEAKESLILIFILLQNKFFVCDKKLINKGLLTLIKTSLLSLHIFDH